MYFADFGNKCFDSVRLRLAEIAGYTEYDLQKCSHYGPARSFPNEERLNRRVHPYHRPQVEVASRQDYTTFGLPYNDLSELMVCLTTESFRSSRKHCASYDRSKKRFANYHFRRTSLSHMGGHEGAWHKSKQKQVKGGHSANQMEDMKEALQNDSSAKLQDVVPERVSMETRDEKRKAVSINSIKFLSATLVDSYWLNPVSHEPQLKNFKADTNLNKSQAEKYLSNTLVDKPQADRDKTDTYMDDPQMEKYKTDTLIDESQLNVLDTLLKVEADKERVSMETRDEKQRALTADSIKFLSATLVDSYWLNPSGHEPKVKNFKADTKINQSQMEKYSSDTLIGDSQADRDKINTFMDDSLVDKYKTDTLIDESQTDVLDTSRKAKADKEVPPGTSSRLAAPRSPRMWYSSPLSHQRVKNYRTFDPCLSPLVPETSNVTTEDNNDVILQLSELSLVKDDDDIQSLVDDTLELSLVKDVDYWSKAAHKQKHFLEEKSELKVVTTNDNNSLNADTSQHPYIDQTSSAPDNKLAAEMEFFGPVDESVTLCTHSYIVIDSTSEDSVVLNE